MSRLKRVATGLASSYVLLAASIASSLISVPLALHYLGREPFALWSLMVQLVGYMTLVDLGMSGSIARLLIDYKDDLSDRGYSSMLTTAACVSLTQGAILTAAGWILSGPLARSCDIPPDLEAQFLLLLRWQAVIEGIGFPARLFTHVLYAHQRLDVVNYAQAIQFAGGLVALWTGFHLGFGVHSILLANAVGLITTVGITWRKARALGFLPADGTWGAFSPHHFGEMFRYGRDLFLVSLGAQLINASQPVIISRNLGLSAVAAWSVGIKMFNLANQVVWRILDLSAPALSEMVVRGEQERVKQRYREIAVVSASTAAWAGVTFAFCNSAFVPVWTHNKIGWPIANDALLGVWIVVLALLHCHNGFILILKRVGAMRWVYFIEGVVFCSIAFGLRGNGGMPAVITASVLCSIAFSGAYGVYRIREHFRLEWREVLVKWQAPALRVAIASAAVVGLAAFVSRGQPDIVRLCVVGGAAFGPGLALLLRLGVPADLRSEALARLPKRLKPATRFAFGAGDSQAMP